MLLQMKWVYMNLFLKASPLSNEAIFQIVDFVVQLAFHIGNFNVNLIKSIFQGRLFIWFTFQF